MGSKRAARGALVLVCSVPVLVGCGGGKSDKGKSGTTGAGTSTAPAGAPAGASPYEARLKDLLGRFFVRPGEQQGSTTVTSVRCPAGVKPAKGASFQCQVTGTEGLRGSVTVTLDDAQGRKFHIKGKLQSASGGATVSGNSELP